MPKKAEKRAEVGLILNHPKYGDYQIIKDIGWVVRYGPSGKKYRVYMVRIKFLVTGYEYDCEYRQALDGKVKDDSRLIFDLMNKTFQSNSYGPYIIIEDLGTDKWVRYLKIQFLATGYTKKVRYEDAMNGDVKDDTFNNAFEARNVIGKSQIINVEKYLKHTWRDMMRRCSNPEYSSNAKHGTYVCDEWKNSQEQFIYDVQYIPGWYYKYYDSTFFQLDKDLLQIFLPYEQRVYAKNTCIWLPITTNAKISTSNYGQEMVKTYFDDMIYEIDNVFYVKSHHPQLVSFGPFFCFDEACHALQFYEPWILSA